MISCERRYKRKGKGIEKIWKQSEEEGGEKETIPPQICKAGDKKVIAIQPHNRGTIKKEEEKMTEQENHHEIPGAFSKYIHRSSLPSLPSSELHVFHTE